MMDMDVRVCPSPSCRAWREYFVPTFLFPLVRRAGDLTIGPCTTSVCVRVGVS